MANTSIVERQVTLAGEKTAYHEAGHAVVALACGLRVRRVSIIRSGDKLGVCSTSFPRNFAAQVLEFAREKNDEELIRQLTKEEEQVYIELESRRREATVALAGRAVSDFRRGWNLEKSLHLLEESVHLSRRLFIENVGGLSRDIQRVTQLSDCDAKSFEESKGYLLEVYTKARKIVEQPQYWLAIKGVKDALLGKGILRRKEVERIYNTAIKQHYPERVMALMEQPATI